jgi:hypothetical protein
MAETIHVRGEGGGIHAMDLPLPEAIAERLTKGLLTRVNADGSPYAHKAPAEPAEKPDPKGDGRGDDGDENPDDAKEPAEVPGPPAKAPAKAAPKAEWVGWAVVNGADPEAAEALSKTDLIEQYSNQ